MKATRAVSASAAGSLVSSAVSASIGSVAELRGAGAARPAMGWTTGRAACAAGAGGGMAIFTVPPGPPKSAAQYHL